MFFNGNYIDELDKELEITQVLQMKPNILNSYYGMELGPERGFTIDDSIFQQRKSGRSTPAANKLSRVQGAFKKKTDHIWCYRTRYGFNLHL